MNTVHDLIIIGSGPAGLTAAIYAARAELKPQVFTGLAFGGQLTTTSLVENYPGFPEGVQGPKLMMDMSEQAKKYGAELVMKEVSRVDFTGAIKKVYVGEEEYQTKSIILATGSSPRTLGIPGEQEYWGKGVSTCATCDGAFYKDKVVAVIGGGDTAMEEAHYLTKHASKVYVIHRKTEFSATKIMQDRVIGNAKVEIIWEANVEEVIGDKTVTALKLSNGTELKVDGMFLAIGHTPNTKFLKKAVNLDERGYIEVTDNTKTSVEGIFVAGDVRDHVYQQAVTAAGMGCMAAMDAQNWLS